MATLLRRPVAAVIDVSRAWLLPSAMERGPWPPVLGLAYIATIATLGGLNGGHIVLGMLGFLDVYNPRTRLFLRTFFPCVVAGILYDSLRYVLRPAIAGRIHVAGPYLLERAWFGVGGHTLNEVFALHHWAVADIAAGIAYLVYVAQYMVIAMVLFFRGNTVLAHTWARGFCVVNVMGFITQLAYPAAPPWYVAAHGLGAAQIDAAPSPAGAQRFDQLLGTHTFADVYHHNLNVFGALPSLHAAYPALALILVWRTQALYWLRAPVAAYALLMWFSAIYLQHHYMIDVLLGIVYATVTAAIVLAWERRRP